MPQSPPVEPVPPPSELDDDLLISVEDMQSSWSDRLDEANRRLVRANALLAARTRQRDADRAEVKRLREQVEDLTRELAAAREGDTEPAPSG